jgi:hypothetical protein
VIDDAGGGKEEARRMILALATALMEAIHVAGAYLGLRDSPILREVGGLSPFLRRCTE